MNQQFKIKVSPRAQTGRSSSRRLRKAKQIPAVLYGKHTSPESVSVDGVEFGRLVKAIAGNAALIELDRPGASDGALAFLQEVQRDPMTDQYLHVDFHEVKSDEKFEIRVRIRLTGEAIGVKTQSGLIETPTYQLRIRCLPKDLPSFIEVDISELELNETIHVGDLKELAGVEFLDDDNQAVVSCVEPPAEEVVAETAPTAAEGAAAAAPAEGAAAAAPAAGAAAAAPGAAAAPAAPAKK